jgi:hypothetical protein
MKLYPLIYISDTTSLLQCNLQYNLVTLSGMLTEPDSCPFDSYYPDYDVIALDYDNDVLCTLLDYNGGTGGVKCLGSGSVFGSARSQVTNEQMLINFFSLDLVCLT